MAVFGAAGATIRSAPPYAYIKKVTTKQKQQQKPKRTPAAGTVTDEKSGNYKTVLKFLYINI